MHPKILRWLSPTTFGISFLCFFMPFTLVTCNNHGDEAKSGVQIIFSTQQTADVQEQSPRHPQGIALYIATYGPQVVTGLAFLLVVIGFISTLVQSNKKALKWQRFYGIAAFCLHVTLFAVLKYFVQGDLGKNPENVIEIKVIFKFWFYLSAFMLFLSFLIANKRLKDLNKIASANRIR